MLSDARRDRRLKRDLYARAGVAEYWVVDPDSNWVEVYQREGEAYGERQILEDDDILSAPLLPGLEVPLAKLFRT